MKKQLFSMICLMLLVAISILATGCAAPGQTKAEVQRRHVDTWSTQQLQFQDAVDAWLMIDRPPRNSWAYVR
ncbi:MAG: hypothetical protein ACYSUT_04255 [Planctomycetota bacterium]|jgi:hypothetical protein